MTAQQLHTNRMECAKPRHTLDLLTQHTPHAVFHLAGGFVGKGYSQNLVGARPTCVHQVNNAGRKRLGFTSACPCQHQHRAIHLLNGGALGWI